MLGGLVDFDIRFPLVLLLPMDGEGVEDDRFPDSMTSLETLLVESAA